MTFLRWLLGLSPPPPARQTLIMEFKRGVVEVVKTDLPDGSQKFDLVILSGPPWSEAEAIRVLAFFKAELDRLARGEGD